MKILILNRRDIANPAGGGAEIYTHEIARGLVVAHGCDVTGFSSRFPNSAAEEIIDGVRYIRQGNEATVHLRGFVYALKNRSRFDLIIDEFNGVGFFTFFLPSSVLLIHQLYKEFWFRELGIAWAVPYVLEPLLLRLYRKRLAITISRSTKEDLERRGFRRVQIVMVALGPLPERRVPKDEEPTLVFLGRLRSTKRPEDAIEIFRRVKARIPEARLWIIGKGQCEEDLRRKAEGMSGITFHGFVDEEKKMELLARAHVLVVPSVREGFGINVIEAASAGSPTVGYDVPGLRDAIQHGETGYLADSITDASARIIGLLADRAVLERMSRKCLDYAREFVWRRRVDEFWEIIRGARK